MRNRISLPFSARSRSSCGHALPALVMIATVVVMSQPAPADQIFADWDAGTPGCDVGVWTDMCWGNEPMPNNGNMGHTYVAGISDGNANVTMNIAITLDGLVIFGGGQVNTMIIPNSRTLTIVGGPSKGNPTGFIDINDKLLMQSTGGNPTDLKVTAGPDNSTLVIGSPASPGELRMSNHINNRIYGATGTETIIFGTDLTVGGAGQIGVNATTLINQGTILADQSNALRIDPNAGGMTNSGLMVARDGGLLQFQPGVYDNALGEIRAEDASTVRFLGGAEISGGLMVAESGGLFEFNGGTLLGPTVRIDVGGVGQVTALSTVLNLTNDGVINQNNSTALHTAGQLNNTGNYFMNQSGGNPTDLIFDSDTVLDGGGVINMSNHLNNRIYGLTGAEIFTNVDNTIRGSGQIGVNVTTLINQGTILADQSTELRIDPGTGGMTNSGLMVARDGGLLQFQPGVYDNALGEIRAEDLSTVRFPSGAEITGGLMVAESGGLFEFNGGTLLGPTVRIDVGGFGQVIFNSTVLNLTNDGVINHNNSATLHTAGQLNNTGNYFMNHSGGNTTNLIFDSDTVLDGGGVINMSNHINNRIYGLTGAEIFTNVDNTIRGSGQIGLNQTTLINQGTILADQSTELWIDPGAGGMTNSGTLGAENGALLRLQAGPFTTSGFVFALAGSTITRAATDYIQTAGSTKIDGTLILNAGGTVTLDGGILGGSGLVSAHVDNVAGTASPGSSPGTLNIQGDYLQTPTGTLDIELSASVGDLLAMRGAADLAGTLSLSVVVDDEPSVGQMFTIITAGSVTGVFDAVTGPGEYDVIYNPTDVVVTVLALPPNTADISGPLGAGFPDGCVDAFDLGTLLGAWCSAAGDPDPPKDEDPPCEDCTSPNFALADISGEFNVPDGCVDAFDLAKLLANWCSVAGGNPCGTCLP